MDSSDQKKTLSSGTYFDDWIFHAQNLMVHMICKAIFHVSVAMLRKLKNCGYLYNTTEKGKDQYFIIQTAVNFYLLCLFCCFGL